MRPITRGSRGVPLARRQLLAQPARLTASILAVAAAVALVLLLAGLRRGLSDQVTLYLDRQPAVVVGQRGMRDFLSQSSVLPETVARDLRRVPGVDSVVPVAQQFAMLRLHDRHVLALLVGYDRATGGGPWKIVGGHEPAGPRELVVDRVFAEQHDLRVASIVRYRGERLRVVGISSGTSGFMTPLAFATRETVNRLGGQPRSVNFFFVAPAAGVGAVELSRRIEGTLPGVAALPREQVAENDRALFAGAFSGPLLAMVAIALVAAALVVALTVYGSTVERAREYATLKAIGARARRLAQLATAQALGIAGIGTIAGIALAASGRELVERVAPQYLVVIVPSYVGAVAAASLVVALVAAAVPARLLARLAPAEAFRR